MYKKLEPYRSTILHNKKFSTDNGEIYVENTKWNASDTPINISAHQLRILTITMVTILKSVLKEWVIDDYVLKQIRYNLDQINNLHGLPLLDQKRPMYSTVRIYWPYENPIEIDFDRIQNDISNYDSTIDCLFNVRIVRIKDGHPVDAYLFPWKLVREINSNELDTNELQKYICEIPSMIKDEHISSAVG